MFNPEDIKKVYEQNYNIYMDLIKTNTNVVKDYMALQSELMQDFLKESNSSVASMSSIKTPADFEKFLKDAQTKLEDKMKTQSKKYLDLCQSYQNELSKVVEQLSNNNAELVKKVKKS